MFLAIFVVAVEAIVVAGIIGAPDRSAGVAAQLDNSLRPKSKPRREHTHRIAVVLRGQSFRTGGHLGGSCSPEHHDEQIQATDSLMKFIVKPLEKQNNTIDLVITDGICDLNQQLLPIYHRGGRRQVHVKYFEAPTQAENFKKALRFFEKITGGESEIAITYDHVIITRHDMFWRKSVVTWQWKQQSFNLASPCDDPFDYHCVSDLLYIMPGHLYADFKSVNTEWPYGPFCSHWCYDDLRKKLRRHGADINFLFWSEPREKIRADNDAYRIYDQKVEPDLDGWT